MISNEGIIIKSISFQDSNKIITLITKDGKKSLIAKSAANFKAHHFSHTQELSKIGYEEKKNYLAQAKLLEFYTRIREDFSKLKSAMFVLELTDQIADHVTDCVLFYQFFDEILFLINDLPKNEQLYEIVFRLKSLYLLGISPIFHQCVECGSKEQLVGFSFYNGGMKCINHFTQQDNLYDMEIVKNVQFLYGTKLPEIKKIANEYIFNYSKLDSFLSTYYEYFLGFHSKSKPILNQFDKIIDMKK